MDQAKPEREPDLPGPAPAWKITIPDDLDTTGKAGVGDSWLVYSPLSHPFWAWHFIAMVHLRDVPDQEQDPIKDFAEATHEVMCFAIDPSKDLPDPDNWMEREDGIFLSPPDWVVQFHVHSDQQAQGVLEAIMRAVTGGQSVDSDLRSWWQTSIQATAAHYREGVH